MDWKTGNCLFSSVWSARMSLLLFGSSSRACCKGLLTLASSFCSITHYKRQPIGSGNTWTQSLHLRCSYYISACGVKVLMVRCLHCTTEEDSADSLNSKLEHSCERSLIKLRNIRQIPVRLPLHSVKFIFSFSCLKAYRLTFWHRRFTFNSNKSPTWCNNFSVSYPDICLQLIMFRAFSRPSSGAQWLQWQPVVLPSYRDDSRAGPEHSTTITTIRR